MMVFATCLLGDQPTSNIALAERRDKAGADDKPCHLSVLQGPSQGKALQKRCGMSICTMSILTTAPKRLRKGVSAAG